MGRGVGDISNQGINPTNSRGGTNFLGVFLYFCKMVSLIIHRRYIFIKDTLEDQWRMCKILFFTHCKNNPQKMPRVLFLLHQKNLVDEIFCWVFCINVSWRAPSFSWITSLYIESPLRQLDGTIIGVCTKASTYESKGKILCNEIIFCGKTDRIYCTSFLSWLVMIVDYLLGCFCKNVH